MTTARCSATTSSPGAWWRALRQVGPGWGGQWGGGGGGGTTRPHNSILQQGHGDMFRINASTGEICTARDGLDREVGRGDSTAACGAG